MVTGFFVMQSAAVKPSTFSFFFSITRRKSPSVMIPRTRPPASVTAAAMSAVPVDKSGVGSAVLNSMRQVGGSLGIAVMGAIVASTTASSLRAGDTARIAFLHGFHDALRVGSAIAFAGAIVATLAIRSHAGGHARGSVPEQIQEAA